MDPFKEVQEDCWSQINNLQHFIQNRRHVTPEAVADFSNNYQELAETLEDLRQAVHISESNPAQFSLSSEDIAGRKKILGQLSQKATELSAEWERHVADHRPREVTTMSNRISQDSPEPREYGGEGYGGGHGGSHSVGSHGIGSHSVGGHSVGGHSVGGRQSGDSTVDREFNHFQQQEVLHTQDLQLDSIHKTMQSLNQQATMMGVELEDQGYMLDELDAEMDTVGGKLSRGMRRVNYVIERNRDSASNWCIGILAVVLCVLLFILIAV